MLLDRVSTMCATKKPVKKQDDTENGRDIVAELQQMLDDDGIQATFYGQPVNLVELRDDLIVRIAVAVTEVHSSEEK